MSAETYSVLRDALVRTDLTCSNDALNPCWNNRPTDVAGKHWGGGSACSPCCARAALHEAQTTALRLADDLYEAEQKAVDALARYKFQMFGYWAAIWVHLNRVSGARRPNPFKGLVAQARIVNAGYSTGETA